MDENEAEEDPFSTLTEMCHVTASQEDILSSAVLARQHERFPTDDSQEASDYSFPMETVGIRMESPPEEEFLTPDDDSLSAFSSRDPILAVDPFNDPTVMIEGSLLDDFVAFKRKADKVFDKMHEKKISVSVEDEVFDEMPVGKRSRGLTGSVEEQVFDETLTRDEEVKMGIRGNSVEVVGFEEDCVFRKDKFKMNLDGDTSIQVVDLDNEEMCRNEEAEKDDENISTEVVDLADEEMCRNKEAGKDDENVSTEVVELDDKEMCKNEEAEKDYEKISTEVVDLDDEEMCKNEEPEKVDEKISTEIVDLDENGAYDDLSMRNVDREMGKNTSADVGLDEDGLYGDITIRNLGDKIGHKEREEVRRGEIRGISQNDSGEIDNRKSASLDDENRLKDIGKSELYDQSSQRKKEIDNALNIGFSEIGTEEIDKPEVNNEGISVGGSRKPCGNKPSGDVIRGFFRKHANTSKGDNNHQKGKSQVRKLPFTLDKLAETVFSGSNVSHREGNKCENEIFKSVGGEITNDQIMKNLLDGLDLIIGKKEKVDNGSNEEVDILETAIRMGFKFPRPRWWPEEGFGDD